MINSQFTQDFQPVATSSSPIASVHSSAAPCEPPPVLESPRAVRSCLRGWEKAWKNGFFLDTKIGKSMEKWQEVVLKR